MLNNPTAFAKDEAKKVVEAAFLKAVSLGKLSGADIPDFTVEVPADTTHGDFASNAALVSAKAFHQSPRAIAQTLAECSELEGTMFSKIEVAGPGFINLFAGEEYYSSVVGSVLVLGENYGRTNLGEGKKVMVEFVSANPTGPMHIGNARGAALGDCLASVLDAAGYTVTREFYLNDTGNQVAKFGRSLDARYREIYDPTAPFPEDGYHGADITERAKQYADKYGDVLLSKTEEERQTALTDFALPLNVAGLEYDLERYRVKYDVWFKESALHESGLVSEVVDMLAERGATYEKDGAVWYRSSEYSEKYGANKNSRKGPDGEANDEDKDEVLIRANGVPTYFAADIAYHYNKFAVRGFDTVINVWGADHHGHVARMKGSMDAVGLNGDKLDIVLMQLVRLVRDGEPVRVSKRSGNSITLGDLLDEIPVDAARFFFNLREPSSHFDFDMGLAVSDTSDNPVYYVQYAHARICSILKALEAQGVDVKNVTDNDFSLLNTPEERALIKHIAALPAEIETSARDYDPAKITRYTLELATLFHRFYAACRVKDAEPALRAARVSLCVASRTVLENCLNLLKVTAPETM